jgi:fatty acid desaturase
MSSQQSGNDVVVIEHETLDRLANIVVTVVPLALLAVAIWMASGRTLHWQDLFVLVVSFILTVVGVTIGYHRLFTHRSFKTSRPLRALLAVLGSAAVEGPVIEWVSTHRKHHAVTDLPVPMSIAAPAGEERSQGCVTPTSDGRLAALTARVRHGTRRTCSPTR